MPEPTVLITGASGGLGTSVVAFFLNRGYRVIATVSSDAGKEDMAPHPGLDVQVADLSDEAATTAFVEGRIASYGAIDAAILLVGAFAMGSLIQTKGADLARMFSLNFETAYYVARPLYAHMLEQGKGRIVFIGARPAIVPSQGKNAVAYALSKSLLFQLAEILNADARGKDVVANVVVPSTIDTPANRKSMSGADFDSWVRPEQLAAIFHFICSDAAAPLRDPVWKVYNKA
jgi:NAD(P)-dependent dehydrogenase (short-subunit alcohol dehydrogenase family)